MLKFQVHGTEEEKEWNEEEDREMSGGGKQPKSNL